MAYNRHVLRRHRARDNFPVDKENFEFDKTRLLQQTIHNTIVEKYLESQMYMQTDALEQMLSNARKKISNLERTYLPAILDLADERNPERIVFAAIIIIIQTSDKTVERLLGSYSKRYDFLLTPDCIKIRSVDELIHYTFEHIRNLLGPDIRNEKWFDKYKAITRLFSPLKFDPNNDSCMETLLENMAWKIFNTKKNDCNTEICVIIHRILEHLIYGLNLYKLDHTNSSPREISRRYGSYLDLIRAQNSLDSTNVEFSIHGHFHNEYD